MKKSQKILEAAGDADCLFFARNPFRKFRIRRAVPGENGNKKHNALVASFLRCDSKVFEVQYAEFAVEQLPADSEQLGSYLFERAVLFEQALGGMFRQFSASELEAAKQLCDAPLLPKLQGTTSYSVLDGRIDGRLGALMAVWTIRAKTECA